MRTDQFYGSVGGGAIDDDVFAIMEGLGRNAPERVQYRCLGVSTDCDDGNQRQLSAPRNGRLVCFSCFRCKYRSI